MTDSERSGLILITGGSRGIGAATARLAAERGWDVLLTYIRDESAAADVVAQCEKLGRRAVAHRFDAADPSAVDGLFARVDELGGLRGLVNNAGVNAPPIQVADMTADRVIRAFTANVVVPMLVAGQAVRRMARSRGGSGGAIVNVSSRASEMGAPGRYVDYAASKAALDGMTIGLGKEVVADGVRVNAVRPGVIETAMHATIGEPDRPQAMAASIPAGRPGRPEEVAETILWLLSDSASYVAGAILDVSGAR
jgi:NAD(P)-dependent dehydrogenase (short-subunit alcohol dehydrogenase family)